MSQYSWKAKLAKAKSIIDKAEAALGKLSSGQRRDLLMDNTKWSYDTICQLVDDLEV